MDIELLYKFNKRFTVIGECWIWIGAPLGPNYGGFKYNGIRYYAHRFSYELFIGGIPIGLEVMHSCDTPPCVNPKHLKVGTHSDNIRDKVIRGRHVSQRSKLSASDLDSIKQDWRTQSEIADDFGISQCYVSQIQSGYSPKPALDE